VSSFRKERVREQLHSFLSEQMRKMRDPRLQLLSINDIDLSGDMQVAKVYWVILGGKPDDTDAIAETKKAIEGSVGFLRKKIAGHLKLRVVPELRFSYDTAAITGGRIDELLGTLSKN